jgi:hypothetical protein
MTILCKVITTMLLQTIPQDNQISIIILVQLVTTNRIQPTLLNNLITLAGSSELRMTGIRYCLLRPHCQDLVISHQLLCV